MLLFQRRSQIVSVKTDGALGSPCTARIRRVAVSLVLVYHHVDIHALFLVGVNELAEHVGVCLQVTGILDEIVRRGQLARKLALALACKFHLVRIHFAAHVAIKDVVHLLGHIIEWTAQHGIVAVDFHPAWRTPWGHPKRQVRIVFLCSADKWNNSLFVAVNVEISQFQVAGHLVAAVP